MSAPKSDKAAIRQTIRALRKAGWELWSVDDREEETRVGNETEAIEAITGVDEAFLHVNRGKVGDLGRSRGWVFFVLGNDPEEVINDHTINLSDVIDPLTDTWWD